MYKIFFKDRVINLTDHIDIDLTPDFGAIHKLGSEGELRKFLREFENNEDRKEAFIYHHNKYDLFRQFRKYYKNLLAAGGLVWNKDKTSFLTIHRLGRPDLPKGKVEPGESFEEAALREVFEECGIENRNIVAPLGPSFHIYHINNLPVLKETRWFEMIYNGNKKPVPQIEEDITHVAWTPVSKMEQFAKETYPSIREIVKKAQLIRT